LRHHCTYDATPAMNDLKIQFRSLDEAIIDSVPPMLENKWV
jgi:hypothetical protein